MKRFLPYIFILAIVVGIFLPTSFASAELVDAAKAASAFIPGAAGMIGSAISSSPVQWATAQIGDITATAIMNLLTFLSYVLMKLSSLVLGLSALILDKVINVTILGMSEGISKMTGLNAAWKIIRDLMNIVFIFLLVYKGIMLIISQENRDSIQNFIFMIVLSSLLINFSLFFTKVIIDSSNIVTTGIYSAIVPPDSWGISTSIMKSLGIQNAWSSANLPTGTDITTEAGDTYARFSTNLLSIALFLVTAFTFLAVSAMLMVRYVILMFLLVLSPVAYMGLALNELKPHAKKWWETLMGQATFAPLFMIMMLITLKMIEGLFALGPDQYTSAGSFLSTNSGSVSTTANVLFSFSIIIGMIIGSLVMAKKYSTQGHEYASKLSGWATGKVAEYGGRAVFGSAGAISRNTVGAVASRAAQSQAFQNAAANNWFAEKALRATRRTADSSFDVRATAAGSSLAGVVGGLGKAQTGGFNQTLKDITKTQQEFSDSLNDDASKRAYASRIAGGAGVVGGSRPGNRSTVLGTMGRANRIVASKTLFGQLDPLVEKQKELKKNIGEQDDAIKQLENDRGALIQEREELEKLGEHVDAVAESKDEDGNIIPGTPEKGRSKQEDRRYKLLIADKDKSGSILNIQEKIEKATKKLAGLKAQNDVISDSVDSIKHETDRLGISSELTPEQIRENGEDMANGKAERHTQRMTTLTPMQEAENAADVLGGKEPRHKPRPLRAHEQNY